MKVPALTHRWDSSSVQQAENAEYLLVVASEGLSSLQQAENTVDLVVVAWKDWKDFEIRNKILGWEGLM